LRDTIVGVSISVDTPVLVGRQALRRPADVELRTDERDIRPHVEAELNSLGFEKVGGSLARSRGRTDFAVIALTTLIAKSIGRL
jgi:hypothetical protein